MSNGGPMSPTLAEALAPRTWHVQPHGRQEVPNPRWRWYAPWRRRLTWSGPRDVLYQQAVDMAWSGGDFRSQASVVWYNNDPLGEAVMPRVTVDRLVLLANGQPVAVDELLEPRELGPGDRLWVEQVRFAG